jgi:glutathione S-transferase
VKLQRVSNRLADKPWLEGERFTIGDLMMVTVLRLADRGQLLCDTPNLIDYVARGEARPSFHVALEDQLATFAEHEPQGEPA